MLVDKEQGWDLLCSGISSQQIFVVFNMNLCYKQQNKLPGVHKLDKAQLGYQQCADELSKWCKYDETKRPNQTAKINEAWSQFWGRYNEIMSTTGQIFQLLILFFCCMCNLFDDRAIVNFHFTLISKDDSYHRLKQTDLQAVPSGYILVKHPKCNHRKWWKEDIIERQKPVIVCGLSREWCIHLI